MTGFNFDPTSLNKPADEPEEEQGGEFSFNADALKPDLNTPVENAMHVNPDDHAKNLDLSRKSGLPTALVEQDQKTVEDQVKSKEIHSTLGKHKFTATWMSEEGNASLAIDDVDSLSTIENLSRGIVERAGDVGAGMLTFSNTVAAKLEEKMPLGTFEIRGGRPRYVSGAELQDRIASGERYGVEVLEDYLKELDFGHKEEELASWQSVKDRPLANVLPFIFEQGILSLPDMAMAMVNLPMSTLSMTGRISEERATNEGRTAPTVEDLIKVLPAAAASSLLDRFGGRGILGLDDAVKGIGVKPLAAAIGKGFVKEGVTEAIQGSLENIGATLGTERGFDFSEMLEAGLQEGLVGTGFGGSIRTVTASAEMAGMAIQDAATLKEMNAQESALKERSPEKYAEFQGKLLREKGIEQISISGEGFAEFNQSGGDTSWIEALGLSESGRLEMFEAMDGDVELTPEQYSLIPPEIAQALNKHIRINDGMTEAEAEMFNSEGMQDEFERISESFKALDPEGQQDAQMIQQRIEDQLQAVGESPETSSYYGVLMAQRYVTRAERSGQGALEMYMKDNLNIRQGEQMQQAVDDLTINLDRARSDKTKEEYLGLEKQPVIRGVIRSHGGVDPDSDFAAELKRKNITRAMVPGLFKEGGAKSADDFVHAEFPFFKDKAEEADLNSFIHPDALIAAIEREAFGEDLHPQSEMSLLKDFDESVENFTKEMESLDMDINVNTDEEIRAAIEGKTLEQFAPTEPVNITKEDPVFSIPTKELKHKNIKVQDEDGVEHTIEAKKAVTIMRRKLNQAKALVDCVNAN